MGLRIISSIADMKMLIIQSNQCFIHIIHFSMQLDFMSFLVFGIHEKQINIMSNSTLILIHLDRLVPQSLEFDKQVLSPAVLDII